ncbi:hypothetical protein QTP88_008369 [Uroleucon formosanum]
MSNESESNEDIPNKRRKGVIRPKTYKRNIIKESRTHGKEYINYKGNKICQKTPPHEIKCKCPALCFKLITKEVLSDIWTKFYSMENKNSQDIYLQSLIEKKGIKRRTKYKMLLPIIENRNETNNIVVDETDDEELEYGDQNVQTIFNDRTLLFINFGLMNVFIATHGVIADRVRRLSFLLSNNKTPEDKRGKNISGNAIPGDICVEIHQHINQFNVKNTHYGGKPKKYLNARLNIVKMHQMFLKDIPDLAVKVKYNFYYKYFKDNFDYTFGRPQVDVCSQCESLNTKIRDPALSESAKRGAAGELVLHKRRAKKFYTELNTPIKIKMMTPSFYVLTTCQIYPYRTYLFKRFFICVSYGDGAAGQNKNHTVVRFLMNLCDRGKFETITHFFPVRGHSFLPCDRDFGSIKRLLRKTDRIYTPQQYAQLIIENSRCGRFSIHKVQTDEILNFKNWWPSSYKKTVNSDETLRGGIHKDDRISFKISSYKHFIFRHRLPGKVEVKTFINGLFSSMFTFRKTNQSPDLPTNKAYPTGKVPINKKKIDDLKKLSEYTTDYSDFYNIILSWPTSTQEEGMHDSEYEEQ